jgi:hypothetical protein
MAMDGGKVKRQKAEQAGRRPGQRRVNAEAEGFVDGRTGTAQLAQQQARADASARVAQLREASALAADGPRNQTGMPDALKAGIESLSGMDMSAVRVHRNSDKPAQLNAHAYAQGTEIHLAPGQEQHLPHEAWHVVQQMQGRVQPTRQMKADGVPINDNPALEQEADVMGQRALRASSDDGPASAQLKQIDGGWTGIRQAKPVIQCQFDDQQLREMVENEEYRTLMLEGATPAEREQFQEYFRQHSVEQAKQAKWAAALASRVTAKDCVSWDFDNERYHINGRTETLHVTKEKVPKCHYFFTGTAEEIEDAQPTAAERGMNAETKSTFSKLPPDVQEFIRHNYFSLLVG